MTVARGVIEVGRAVSKASVGSAFALDAFQISFVHMGMLGGKFCCQSWWLFQRINNS